MRGGRGAIRAVAFFYPYVFYHLFFLWNWASWYKRPFELGILVALLIFIFAEYLLAFFAGEAYARGDERTRKVIVRAFFISFPLILALVHIMLFKDLWLIWFMSLLYHVYRGFLGWSYLTIFLIAVGSIALFWFVHLAVGRRFRILLGLYLPWMLFLSPFFYKYLVSGFVSSDISKYSYIEPVVHPLGLLGYSPEKASVLPLARGLYIENDTIYTAYQADVLFVYPSSAESSLFIYDMNTRRLTTVELPGRGVRRMFSRPSDPYLYFILWKWGYGFFRMLKSNPTEIERLLDLAPAEVYSDEFKKLRQLSYVYVDSSGDKAYLLSELYPSLARFDLKTKVLDILDLTKLELCPVGSFLPDVPAFDPDERFMFIAPNHCICGVFKVDLERFDVAGCYQVPNPNYALWGPVLYRDGRVYAFPFSRDARTLVLDARSMTPVAEYEPPPFDGIREVVWLDDTKVLCLSFFGHLAVFDLQKRKYRTLIRDDLGISMGLVKYGDYVYINSSRHGILRIKLEDILRLSE